VSVGHRAVVQREQTPQFLFTHRALLQRTFAVHHVLQTFFAELPLEHLLLDGTGGEETVQVALLLLAVAPASRCTQNMTSI
jgi:hypothetical protein